MICLMATCVLPMAKSEKPVDFVIKGRVTDAQTGEAIAGARVGDDKYSDGKQWITTDSNGNYSYKTWYEEHNIKCEAEGYQVQNNILLTKVSGKEKEKVINFQLKIDPKIDVQIEAEKPAGQDANEAGEELQKSADQGEKASDTNNISDSSAAQENVKKAKALRITVYEGNNKEPQTSVYIPIAAMRIVRSLLPPKDKLQIIAQKIKLDEELPEGLDSETLIDMLEEMLRQVDQGIESTTLLEVKDGTERVIIELE
jgi:hypothetical protein